MRQLLPTLALIAALAGPAAAQDGPAASIQDVIRSQIDAFLQDDFETAFTYASPGIQSLFGTPERFGTMVRNGYPMVWRPADVEFLDLERRDGGLWQTVMMRDAAGKLHVLGYSMERGPTGAWKIDGVQILRQPEVGA
jgi:hypothetical protein